LFIGSRNEVAQFQLKDKKGNIRAKLYVDESGEAKLEFIDAKGSIISSFYQVIIMIRIISCELLTFFQELLDIIQTEMTLRIVVFIIIKFRISLQVYFIRKRQKHNR